MIIAVIAVVSIYVDLSHFLILCQVKNALAA